MIVDNDGTTEDAWVLEYEIDELAYLHLIEIDVVLKNDFAPRGDNIVRPVFAFGDNLFDVGFGELFRKDILRLVRDLLLIEPFFDFSAAATARAIIDFDHRRYPTIVTFVYVRRSFSVLQSSSIILSLSLGRAASNFRPDKYAKIPSILPNSKL